MSFVGLNIIVYHLETMKVLFTPIVMLLLNFDNARSPLVPSFNKIPFSQCHTFVLLFMNMSLR